MIERAKEQNTYCLVPKRPPFGARHIHTYIHEYIYAANIHTYVRPVRRFVHHTPAYIHYQYRYTYRVYLLCSSRRSTLGLVRRSIKAVNKT